VLGLTLVANFFHALTSYIAKRAVDSVPPIVLGIARTAILTVCLGMVAYVTGDLVLPSLRALLWMIGGSLFGPFLSYLLFYKGLQSLEMSKAAIIRATQPLFVAFYGFILFGDLLGWIQFLGGMIILAGVIMILSVRSNPKPVIEQSVADESNLPTLKEYEKLKI
jgi:drug/metabolite transporter (DMT)-like permease